MFTQDDLKQFDYLGITKENIQLQIDNFITGFPFVRLEKPALVNEGIKLFDKNNVNELETIYAEASKNREVVKFVPASGAASRMFKNLFTFKDTYTGSEKDYQTFLNDKSFNSVYKFILDLKKFAFYQDLKEIMRRNKIDIDKCVDEKDYATIVSYLLDEKGLNYGNLPKGLLKFHNYLDYSRTSVEEHLVEGANYAKDINGNVKIHFTISPEHKEKFIECIQAVKEKYEQMFTVKYDITFSIQKPSTDTIAVETDNSIFREKDGKILFRPGGHGALIENLNDLKGDIIFIKNIDNVVPDDLKRITHLYKKVIGGYLIELQQKTFDYLKLLEKENISESQINEIIEFACNDLFIDLKEAIAPLAYHDKINLLKTKLNRPMRVCGMVRNEGEPGGGPFWVRNQKEEVSLQIIESSQININNKDQNKIFNASTHFNPVDLVCGVRNYKGEPFNLKQYIDPSTGFISSKSKDGRTLKAQELPGLWNGAMADWISVFVEVPITTFNPVKTVNDLLRGEHQ
ncbi:MAG: DUF4301 family protein [Bacteroidota bacterium]